MLKILQAGPQQYTNQELPDVQAGFRKGKGTKDQMTSICCIKKKQGNSRKIFAASLSTLKPLTVWITTNWKILKELGIPDQVTCLLRNLYSSQEAIVRTGHETIDWFQIGKEVHQGCILSPCFFNLYEEYIIWNARLDKAETGIKIARRNMNNIRYADDTTIMAESKNELKSQLLDERAGLKSEKTGLTFKKQRTWLAVPSLCGK